MLVMLLLGIALASVSLSIGHGLGGRHAKQNIHDLAAALRSTRITATRRGQEATLAIDLTARTWQAPGREAHAFAPELDIRLTTAERFTRQRQGAYVFYPDGSASGGEIHLSDGDQSWRIDIDWLTGGISLVEPGR
ncbi:hypothetical protein L861_14665 [Litchfieldella anticariensis FP35 = DSM 16096]|uniref:General secretion pathway GspH domain-containing protein n=2 Tax=Litchfieldella anticariensis TaxID=258591 RepID=S2KXN2_LITA3|nr:hypothetical protein L861_14665 [Halomonas anticariensis FP35 = DSM 16096]